MFSLLSHFDIINFSADSNQFHFLLKWLTAMLLSLKNNDKKLCSYFLRRILFYKMGP